MPYPSFGGGAGGGGFTLGPQTNFFTGADRAAAESARDTYFTANPSNLAAYNADTNLNIRLEYEASGENVALYQVRNSAGTGWFDNSSAIGVPGRDGMTNIPSAPDGTVPQIIGGQLQVSPIRQTSEGTNLNADLETPKATTLGNIRTTADGFGAFSTDVTNNVHYDVPGRPFTEADGSLTLAVQKREAATLIDFQGRNDASLNAAEYGVNIRNLLDATIFEFISQAPSGGTASGDFYVEIYRGTSATGDPYWSSHTPDQIEEENVFTLDGGNVNHDCRPVPSDSGDLPRRSSPVSLLENTDYFVRFVGVGTNPVVGGTTTTQADVDNPASIFTVAGQQVPFFQTRYWPFELERILTTADLMPGGAPEITAFDLPSQPNKRPPAPFTLSGEQTFTYTITNTSNVTAAVIQQEGATIHTLSESEITAGTADATITSFTLNAGESQTFTLRVTDDQNTVKTRDIVFRVANAHELAYYGTQPTTADFSTVAPELLANADVTQPNTMFNLDQQVQNTEWLGILVPENRDITEIIDRTTNRSVLSRFTRSQAFRTIGGQSYNLYTRQNVSGFTGTYSLTVTVGG